MTEAIPSLHGLTDCFVASCLACVSNLASNLANAKLDRNRRLDRRQARACQLMMMYVVPAGRLRVLACNDIPDFMKALPDQSSQRPKTPVYGIQLHCP